MPFVLKREIRFDILNNFSRTRPRRAVNKRIISSMNPTVRKKSRKILQKHRIDQAPSAQQAEQQTKPQRKCNIPRIR